MSIAVALLKALPALSTPSIVLITVFVVSALIIAWSVYTDKPMTKEEEESDRYYDELYKSNKK